MTKTPDILKRPDVLPIDKLLYIVIGNSNTPPTANNKELAERLGTTPRNIQKVLKRLHDSGYIRIEYAKQNQRQIYINTGTPTTNHRTGAKSTKPRTGGQGTTTNRGTGYDSKQPRTTGHPKTKPQASETEQQGQDDPNPKTTHTAPKKPQATDRPKITADQLKQMTGDFKKLYTDYTGIKPRYNGGTTDYKTAFVEYRGLIESGQNPTIIYKGLIAYRDKRINNGHTRPPLVTALQQRLYRG